MYSIYYYVDIAIVSAFIFTTNVHHLYNHHHRHQFIFTITTGYIDLSYIHCSFLVKIALFSNLKCDKSHTNVVAS